MISARCKDCRAWDNREQFIKDLPKIPWKPNPGWCRRRRAAAIRFENVYVGVHQVMDAEEFCGEFKGNQ